MTCPARDIPRDMSICPAEVKFNAFHACLARKANARPGLIAGCYRPDGRPLEYRVYDHWRLCQDWPQPIRGYTLTIEDIFEGIRFFLTPHYPSSSHRRGVAFHPFPTPAFHNARQAEAWAIAHPELCLELAHCRAIQPLERTTP